MTVFPLQFFFNESMAIRVDSFEIVLDSLQPSIYVLLSLENVAKNFMVESDRIFLDFIQGRSDVGEVPRIFYQLRIIMLIDPGSIETERSWTSG